MHSNEGHWQECAESKAQKLHRPEGWQLEKRAMLSVCSTAGCLNECVAATGWCHRWLILFPLICRALFVEPTLLILDEVSWGAAEWTLLRALYSCSATTVPSLLLHLPQLPGCFCCTTLCCAGNRSPAAPLQLS